MLAAPSGRYNCTLFKWCIRNLKRVLRFLQSVELSSHLVQTSSGNYQDPETELKEIIRHLRSEAKDLLGDDWVHIYIEGLSNSLLSLLISTGGSPGLRSRNIFPRYVIRNRLNLETFFEPIIDFIEIGENPPPRTVYETFISYSSSKNTPKIVGYGIESWKLLNFRVFRL